MSHAENVQVDKMQCLLSAKRNKKSVCAVTDKKTTTTCNVVKRNYGKY